MKPDSDSTWMGRCPKCGHGPHAINIGSTHFLYCPTDKLYFGPWGSNLTSSWRNESREQWKANSDLLDTCTPAELV